MNSFNFVLIEGNLEADPFPSATAEGMAVCTFTVASNRFVRKAAKTEKEVSHFEVEVWGKLALACVENLHQGRGVRVVGRLKQDVWTDPDGTTREKVKIIAEHVEFKPVIRERRYMNHDERFGDRVVFTLPEMTAVYRENGWDRRPDGYVLSDEEIREDILNHNIELIAE